MSDISIGKTVMLKSGGPLMSVGGIVDGREDGEGISVKCDWIDDGGRPQSVFYRIEQIDLDDGLPPEGFTI